MKFHFYLRLIISVCIATIVHFAFAQTGNYFSGTSAGANNTTGDYNAFAGYGAGINNTSGSLNASFGFYAGASNQSTSFNTSIGAYAGYFTSSSFGENVFVGYRSGFYNSSGFYNVMLGSNAGYTNNSGSYNIFIGASAGYDNTSGLSNTLIGYAAGSNNTTASSNTFVGNLAGFQNTTGGSNAFFGSGAGVSNKTGTNNCFVGASAGYYSTASNNTFIGKGAGNKNTTGGVNTFVGSEAGLNNTTGYNNVFFGRTAAQNNTSGFENSFMGRSAGIKNTTGSRNSAIGYMAGPSVGTLSNTTAVGHKAYVTTSNSLVLGSINGVNGATADTKVGIRTTAPAYTLHVNGTAAKPGGGSWTAASDRRLKQNVEDFKPSMEILEKIKPVSFRYNGKAGLPTEKTFVGVIAQDVQKVLPGSVGEFTYQNENGGQEKYLDFDATALTYILVNAAKDLKKENEQLKEENREIRQELAAIKELIISMSSGSGDSEIRLWQNVPNPYSRSTQIKYRIPSNCNNAQIKVYSSDGIEVKSFEISGEPMGEITLSSDSFASGTYLYSLYIDGLRRESKKLILTP